MGCMSCCRGQKQRKGLWSSDEDKKLIAHIAKYGHGLWNALPKLAGLQRCGRSCILRWLNYLRPGLKRGAFSNFEENLIIEAHAALGNRWTKIASLIPGRTDNEIKNFWYSCIKKKQKLIHIANDNEKHTSGDLYKSLQTNQKITCDKKMNCAFPPRDSVVMETKFQNINSEASDGYFRSCASPYHISTSDEEAAINELLQKSNNCNQNQLLESAEHLSYHSKPQKVLFSLSGTHSGDAMDMGKIFTWEEFDRDMDETLKWEELHAMIEEYEISKPLTETDLRSAETNNMGFNIPLNLL